MLFVHIISTFCPSVFEKKKTLTCHPCSEGKMYFGNTNATLSQDGEQGKCAIAMWYGLHWHTRVYFLPQIQANVIEIDSKTPVISREWAWNRLFSWGTRLWSRNCMSAIWTPGKIPASLFIHLMLWLSRSRKKMPWIDLFLLELFLLHAPCFYRDCLIVCHQLKHQLLI